MGGKKKNSIKERMSETFEIPAESFGDVSRITVTGSSRVHIEGHKGLVDLSEESVAVRCKGSIVRINGLRLRLSCMNGFELAVSGYITGLEFER